MEREERGGGLGGFLKEVTIVVVGALIASTLLRLLLLQVFSIPSRSMESTLEVGDRVVFMDNGRIVEQGPPSEVLDHPHEERTQRFLRRSFQIAGSLDNLSIADEEGDRG